MLLTHNWWALAIRGVAAIIFGILAFLWPGITLMSLVLLFGAFAVTDGVFAIIAAVNAASTEKRWWWLLIEGLLSIIAGVLTFFWPGITALFLVYLIGFWAIFTGVFAIVTSIRLRKEIEGEWILALSGLLSVVFGAVLVIFPGAGALALIWWIAAYALASGVLMLILAFKLRRWERKIPHGEPRIA